MAYFRMPCFFFISGMLLSDRYLTDVKGGIIKKLKGYYLPFVKWTLIFLLLHNLFAYLHIYETTYSLQEIVVKIVRTFTMTGGEQLLGGYWFLISLTWASIGSLLYLRLLYKNHKLTYFYILGGVIISIFIASLEHLISFKYPAQFGPQTFLALAFFLSGYLFRKKKFKQHQSPAYECFLWLSIPAISSYFLSMGMGNAHSLSWLYYIIALCGTIGLIQFAKIIQWGKVMPFFNYIGNKTLYILTFHFLSFKLVSYLYILANDLPIEYLSQFPVLKATNAWMWVVYTIAGVGLPLLLWELFHLPVWNFKHCKE